MIANVHLTDEEAQDLREFTQLDDLADAVRVALAEYRRYMKRTRLKELSGQVAMEDNWRALEDAESNGKVIADL